MNGPLELTVQVDDATPDEVAAITRELTEWIADTVRDVTVSPQAGSTTREGDKGDPITVGVILLALVNAGAATALVNCLMTYIKERRRTVKLEVQSPAGGKVSLDAENLKGRELDGLMRQMSELAARAEEPART